MTSLWFIDPHDPLIFRDGKPFGPTPGAYAHSLPFPFPSTTTGGVRTLAGLDADGVFQASHNLDKLKAWSVRGPVLVQLTPDGQDIEPGQWFVPAPGDALVVSSKEVSVFAHPARIVQLIPRPDLDVALTDLHSDLMLLGQRPFPGLHAPDTVAFVQDKVHAEAPRYWRWSQFVTWLEQPETLHGAVVAVDTLGIAGPMQELRVHVTIDHLTHTGKDQHLFDTAGMEFVGIFSDPTTIAASEHDMDLSFARRPLSDAHRLALAVIVEDHPEFPLKEGLNHLAGERRIVSWHKSQTSFPTCPPGIIDKICATKQCRIILLTPANFKEGALPEKLCEPFHGITPTLRAVKVDRPQIVSGWDMRNKGTPRATVRLAPAGTVLFLSLGGNTSRENIEAWIANTWMQCVSDDAQYRLDGFGLAVVGTWDTDPLHGREEHTK